MTSTHYIIPASDVAKLRDAYKQVLLRMDFPSAEIDTALSILDNAQGVGVVANVSQLQNARMFTLTEGAGYDRFAPLYAIQGDSNEG
jgi:hypothetical protein